MAINSFTTLKTAVQDWVDRDDMAARTDDFIAFGEQRLMRELRIRPMETALSVTLSSGLAAVPSDYIQLRYAYIDGSPVQALEMRAPEWIYLQYPTRSTDSKPLYIARDGSNFIFGPFPDSDYTLKGSYYAKLAALSTSNETNWFTTNAPDLLLYAALLEAAPYLGEDGRAQIWAARYTESKTRVENQDAMERFPKGMRLQQAVG